LQAQHQPFLLVDDHPDILHDQRHADVSVVYGHAGARGVLEHAKIDEAHCVILAIPDAIVAGHLITLARTLNPTLITIARTNSETEAHHLTDHGATHVIYSKKELAKDRVRLALQISAA